MADTSSLPSIEHLIRKSAKRTHCLFSADEAFLYTDDSERSTKLRVASKINAEYGNAKVLPAALLAQQKGVGPVKPGAPARRLIEGTCLVRAQS